MYSLLSTQFLQPTFKIVFYDQEGTRIVDPYFSEGKPKATLLGEKVIKYHKTLTTYINSLLQTGLEICELIEP